MAPKTNLKAELDDAINTCYKYVFEIQEEVVSNKPIIFEVLNNLKDENAQYVHHYPYGLVLQLTSNCNLRCQHCFFCGDTQAYNPVNDLSEKEILEHLKYFVEEVNIQYCNITGGEIFTSPSIFKILEYLKSKNVIVELLTNATLITEKTAERLSKVLNHKTDSIQISLEGATEKINDEIRGKGVFQKVIHNVKYLTDRNLNVVLSFTVNSKNADQLEDIYDLCKSLKVSQINVGRFQLYNIDQKYLKPNSDEIFINLAKSIRKFQNDKKVKIRARCIKPFDFLNYETGIRLLDEKLAKENPVIPENLYCHPRHEVLSLFANGDISLCYGCEGKDLSIGNLKEESFNEIWTNRFSKTIYKERKIENTICKYCKYVPLCKGGCPVNAYKKYNTINAPDSSCKYAEKLTAKFGHIEKV